MSKASIAIFDKSCDYPTSNRPDVPDNLFEAVQRVIDTKGVEVLRDSNGFYLIQYSETGPFTKKLNDEWLPVYIACMRVWSSGGITKEEFKSHLESAS